MVFTAAKHNQEGMLRHLLRNFEGQDRPNSQGVTPLMIALKEGNTNIADVLLKQNKHSQDVLEQRDNDKKNLFHYAFSSRKPVKATQVLVSFCRSIYAEGYSEHMESFLTSRDLNADTPFHTLARHHLEKNAFATIFQSLNHVTHTLEGKIERNAKMTSARILECMRVKK